MKKWSLDNIKLGFEKFEKEYGRLPTAIEIDKVKYLPSSRQIQRLFGGLPNIRKLLGYTDIHFGAGTYRANIGKNVNIRGREGEIMIKNFLIQKFHTPFVHIERPLEESTKSRLDFYVYSPSGNFAVDVFTPLHYTTW